MFLSVGKESACNAADPGFNSWVGKIHRKRDRLPTPVFLGFPCGLAGKESTCNAGDLSLIPGLIPGLRSSSWRRKRLPTPVFWPGEFHGPCSPGLKESDTTERLSLHFMRKQGLPWWLSIKNLPANAGDASLIPGSEIHPGEGNGNPLQYSCLENPMDRGTWCTIVHGVAKSWTQFSN